MVEREPYRNRIELLQGTLDLLILKTLTWGAQHGYGITQAIRATSREVLQVDTGSALSGAPPPGAGRALGRLGVEDLREQAARQGLPPDRRRAPAARGRAVAVGAALEAMSLVLDAPKAPRLDEA